MSYDYDLYKAPRRAFIIAMILTVIMLMFGLCTPAPAQSLTLPEKQNLAQKLIEGEECKEQLGYCEQYVDTLKEVVINLNEKLTTLDFAYRESNSVADSLFGETADLKLDLVKEKNAKKAWIKGGIGVIIVEALIIFFTR